jgi:arginyl-tRNA--protein-N-Asp/Glu arginylyltransferase
MEYLHWKEIKVEDFAEDKISELYNSGYVFTRIDKGVMHQTRSIRINLDKFSPSSENKRILKKVADINIEIISLPIPENQYDWKIAKLGKDFYSAKFGEGIMSAQKIKEMLSSVDKSNWNTLLKFGDFGYAICYLNKSIIHYSYPFYDLDKSTKDMGLGMMNLAVKFAKESGLKYIYLGSLQRPNDTYKLQFSGIEWFNGETWSEDLDSVKEILKSK